MSGANLSPTRSASAIARSLNKGRYNQAMMIFKKAIPRRTFIRGAGVALALPLLDGMIPALAAGRRRRMALILSCLSCWSLWPHSGTAYWL